VYVLTFSSTANSLGQLRPVLREISASSAPAVAGLCMRHWGIDRRQVRGRYLFSDRSSLNEFASYPTSDPAVVQIEPYLAEPLNNRMLVEEIESQRVIDDPLFIISSPRAGSTLLYDLLALSAQMWTLDAESEGVIEGIPHLHPANRGFNSHRLTDLDADPETVRLLHAAFLADLRDSQGRRYLEQSDRDRPGRIRLLEKTPENSLRIPFLSAAFPSARFLFLHRDARQCVSSILEGWRHEGFVKIPDLPGWPRRRWHFLLPEGWREMSNRSLLDVAAFQWASANKQALEDLETIPRDRWLSVNYDELIATPETVVRRICKFADIVVDEQLGGALKRSLPISATTISPPSPIKWRNNPEFNESSLGPYTSIRARLRDIDQHAPPPNPAPMGPVRFSCFLDDLTPELESAVPESDWYVNPSFHLQIGATIPLPLLRRTRFRERFLPNYPLLWVEDQTTGVNYPFWTKQNQAYLFRQFVPGLPPPHVEADLAARLVHAGILVTAEGLDQRRRDAEEHVERSRACFAEKGYCVIPSLLHPAHTDALRRYYAELINHGWELGDVQVRQRYGQHNEMVARYFHHQFTEIISRIAGEPIKPSYTYVSAYREGSVLGAHVDRKQCEFTVSLLIEDEDISSTGAWPLWFQLPEGKTAVTQKTGDAVVFRGCDLPHWREQSSTAHTSTVLLFHYVQQDFSETLY
jgi:hypothetical protein